LRDDVATQGGQLGLTTQGVEQLVLVAYELASNAVRHGGGHGRLRLWRTGDTVFCQVTDEGAGFGDAAKAGREPPPPTAPGGRGLWLVRCVAADLELESGDAGTVATAQFGLE
jgi:anti-sigma regulatory factor (Ser/Thr protein kinase)